jgi:cytochrome c peroxidase
VPFRLSIALSLLAACLLALTLASSRRVGDDLQEQARLLRAAYRLPASQWPAPTLDAGIAHRELGLLPAVDYPPADPYSAAKAQLGERLFFDPRLSRSGQIACVSCHEPQLGWADGRRYAFGAGRAQGDMNTPSIANTGHLRELFRDGRATSLEQQATASLDASAEMDTRPAQAAAAIARVGGYAPLFAQAYGDARVDWPRIRDALATFVRGVEVRDTPFDRFLEGDADALDDAAVRGLHLFRTRARCMNCHSGPLLSDGLYHHLGTSFVHVGNYEGRFRVTRSGADMGRFRTPGLRGVARTGPWMHNGLIDDLRVVLELYNNGWWQNAKIDDSLDEASLPRLDPLIRPLGLSRQDIDDLAAFLRALSPANPYREPPPLPSAVVSNAAAATSALR